VGIQVPFVRFNRPNRRFLPTAGIADPFDRCDRASYPAAAYLTRSTAATVPATRQRHS